MATETSTFDFDSVLKEAVKNTNEKKEIKKGFQSMPPVRGAVGKITRAYIGTYGEGKKDFAGNSVAGEKFIYLEGVCIHPETNPQGQKTKDRLTQRTFPLCDWGRKSRDNGAVTVDPVKDSLGRALDEIRSILGMQQLGIGSYVDLEATLKALQEGEPKFMFDVVEKNGYTNHYWQGSKDVPAEFLDGQVEDRVEDDTEVKVEESSDDSGDVSLEELAIIADDESNEDAEDAAAVIQEKADEKGIETSEIATWVEVVELINNS